MDLGDYLKAQMGHPWAWGFSDCTTHAGDWVRLVTGKDPMVKWRGAYKSEADVELLIAEAGGLAALWGEGMLNIWPRVNEFREGYVGIVPVLDDALEPIHIGAIYTGKRWSFRSPRGIGAISIDPKNVVAAWGR